MEVAACGKREDNPDLLFTLDQVASTPSRAEGMSAEKERHERFKACKLAREIVKRLLKGEDSNPSTDRRELAQRAQDLACYYLQLFFMFIAIDDGSQVNQQRQFRAESPHVVALAAVFIAIKVNEKRVLMKELLRAYDDVLRESAAELAEDDSRELQHSVPKVEFELLRIVNFDFDLAMPQDVIEQLVSDFIDEYKRLGYIKLQTKVEVDQFQAKLLGSTRNFVTNSFLGVCPLLFPPRTVAAGALSLAMQKLDRGAKVDSIRESLQNSLPSLSLEDFNKSRDELLDVYRTSSEIQKMNLNKKKTSQTSIAPAGRSSASGPPAKTLSTPLRCESSGDAKACAEVVNCAKQDGRLLTSEQTATAAVQGPPVRLKETGGAAACSRAGVVWSSAGSCQVKSIARGACSPIQNIKKTAEIRSHPYASHCVQSAVA